MNTSLNEISNFIKKNKSFSDYNLTNNFLLNLNFTKMNLKNDNLIGGSYPNNPIIQTVSQDLQDPQSSMPFPLPYQQKIPLDQFEQPYQQKIQPDQFEQSILPQDIMPNYGISQLQNNQILPDMYLQNPPYTTDQINTYTIKEGTILYHATSNKKGFNIKQLNLGQDKLINFFTPNFRLASDKIEGCSVDKQNGFIHVFKVIKDIPNIYVKLPYDIADDINSGILANEFCSKNQNYYGIGFFYPKNNIEMFSNNPNQMSQSISQFDNQNYYSEFGLCNPKPYLEYLYTQKCQSLRKLSDPYRFD